MVEVEDEQPVPPHGLAHALPHPTQRWLGPIGAARAPQQAEESQVGDAPMSDVQNPAATEDNGEDNLDQNMQEHDSDNTNTASLSGAAADYAASGGVQPEVEPHAAEVPLPEQEGARLPLQQVLFLASPEDQALVDSQVAISPPPLCCPIPVSFNLVINCISTFIVESNMTFNPRLIDMTATSSLSQAIAVPSSDDDLKVVDGANFPKRATKKRRAHHYRSPMDVAFLCRSTRKTPSRYRRAATAQAQVVEDREGDQEENDEKEGDYAPAGSCTHLGGGHVCSSTWSPSCRSSAVPLRR